jgi:hypothetical protein
MGATMTKRFFALGAAVLMLLALATVAIADIEEGEFDDDGFVSSDGRHVTTQVSLECDEGERYFLRLTITQDESGALAQARQPGECTEDDMDVVVSAPARGKTLFEANEETEACALVRTRDKSEISDAEQFCEVDINLDEEEEEDEDDEDEDDGLDDL